MGLAERLAPLFCFCLILSCYRRFNICIEKKAIQGTCISPQDFVTLPERNKAVCPLFFHQYIPSAK